MRKKHESRATALAKKPILRHMICTQERYQGNLLSSSTVSTWNTSVCFCITFPMRMMLRCNALRGGSNSEFVRFSVDESWLYASVS